MNIHELIELSSPLPMQIVQHQTNVIRSGETDVAVMSRYEAKIRIADAKLITHCCNNFMTVLKALKDSHEAWAEERRYASNGYRHYPDECDTCNLIKEMETIS